MAISATLSLLRLQVAAGELATAVVAVANSGVDPVVVRRVAPFVPLHVPASPGSVFPRTPVSVPAGGTVNFSFSVVAHGPYGPAAPQLDIAVSALVECSDGSEVVATPAILTAHSVHDDPGGLRFDSLVNSGLAAAL